MRADLSSSLLYGIFVSGYEMTLEVVSACEAASASSTRELMRFRDTIMGEVMRLKVVSSLRGEGALGAGETRPTGIVRAFNPSYDQRAKAGLIGSGRLYRGRRAWPFCDKSGVGMEGVFGH